MQVSQDSGDAGVSPRSIYTLVIAIFKRIRKA